MHFPVGAGLLAMVSVQTNRLFKAAFDAFLHQNFRRDLFHREMRGIDVRNVLSTEQIFHFAHFEFALGIAGVAAVGLALVADGRQAVRVDGQPEQLVRMRAQAVGSVRCSMSSSVSG